jgi:phage tail-like protein
MSLLDYLPAIYQDPEDQGAPNPEAFFLRQFLSAFEAVLLSSGRGLPFRPRRFGREEDADSSRGTGGRTAASRTAGGRVDGSAWQAEDARPEGGSLTYGARQAEDSRTEGGASTWDTREDGPSLEDEIAGLHDLFDPEETPEAFLQWLSTWVALAWRPDLSPSRQRRILANAVRLYRIRGTRAGIEESLRLYLDVLASVDDGDLPPFQIQVHSTVGVDTHLGGGASFLFQVTLAFPREDPEFVSEQTRLAREVIELGRPAHTRYVLRTLYPRFRIGAHSRVGVDTVLAP